MEPVRLLLTEILPPVALELVCELGPELAELTPQWHGVGSLGDMASLLPSPVVGRILLLPQPRPQRAHLNEVPPLVQATLDLVTVQELRQPALGVVHQAAGVREERGGPQSTQVQEAFLGVAGELWRKESSKREGKGEALRGTIAQTSSFTLTLCPFRSCPQMPNTQDSLL